MYSGSNQYRVVLSPAVVEWIAVAMLCLLFVTLPLEALDVRQYYEGAQSWPDIYRLPVEYEENGGLYRIFSPWSAVLFLPLSFIPMKVAAAVVRVALVVSLHFLTGRVFWKTAAVLTAPTALLVANGNLDAISALGLLLPGSGALVLLMVKPQAAALAAPLILRRAGWQHPLIPILVLLLSTLLWPEWIARASLASQGASNLHLFPFGVPFAMILFVQAWRRDDPILAAIASPLAAPYLSMPTLAVTLALLFRKSSWTGQAGCYGLRSGHGSCSI
jgi:hypothetical protein